MADEDDEAEKVERSDDGYADRHLKQHSSFRLPSFSLSTRLISNLERRGLTVPTAVQIEVIPKICNERGKDLCVNAPTGSGKTLAYALPIVEVIISKFRSLWL